MALKERSELEKVAQARTEFLARGIATDGELERGLELLERALGGSGGGA